MGNKLPKIRNQVHTDFISGDPKDYALRILEFYRQRCNENWMVSGLERSKRLIYDWMNKCQDVRKEELDKAIVKLKEGY